MSRILEKQYFSSQAINGKLSSLALHTRSMFPSPADRWNLQRYLLAAQKVFYWRLRCSDAENHQFATPSWQSLCSEWLIPNNLLTAAECNMLGAYPGNRCTALFAMYEQRLRVLVAEHDGRDCTRTGHADFKRAMVEHVLGIKAQFVSVWGAPNVKTLSPEP